MLHREAVLAPQQPVRESLRRPVPHRGCKPRSGRATAQRRMARAWLGRAWLGRLPVNSRQH